MPIIEFTKVYRQSDRKFMNLLNKMRTGNVSEKELEEINKHVNEEGKNDDYSVILTTINQRAEKINEKKLDAIDGEEYCYDAFIENNFRRGDSLPPND